MCLTRYFTEKVKRICLFVFRYLKNNVITMWNHFFLKVGIIFQ